MTHKELYNIPAGLIEAITHDSNSSPSCIEETFTVVIKIAQNARTIHHVNIPKFTIGILNERQHFDLEYLLSDNDNIIYGGPNIMTFFPEYTIAIVEEMETQL